MNEQPLIAINGDVYGNYNYIEIVNEFAAIPSYFVCEYTSLPQVLPKTLDKYSIIINSQTIQQGSILTTVKERTGANNSQNLYHVVGKDNTRLIAEGFCGQIPQQENIDLLSLAKILTKGLDINFISSQPSLNIRRIKPRPDQTIYSVLQQESYKFGLIVYSDGINCIIDKEGSGQTIQASIIDSYYQGNTIATKYIKDYSKSYDKFTSTVFDYTMPTTLSQQRTNPLFGLQKYFYTRDYMSSSELNNSLMSLLNQNLSLENTYQAILPAHVIEGVIPKVGDYMFIEDDNCGIKGLMLIYKTRFMWKDNLSTLELTFKVPGLFGNSPQYNLQLGDQ